MRCGRGCRCGRIPIRWVVTGDGRRTGCVSRESWTRLATGCSWQTAERLLGCEVSDTTLRARRDEWIEAGVFDAVAEEALAAYDRIVGFDLTEVAVRRVRPQSALRWPRYRQKPY